MRKKRTKINCWTVTLFLPRSQLVQDNGPCCVTTCIVCSSLRKDWSRDPIVEEFGPGLLLDKELCCCWSWIVLSRTILFSFDFIVSLFHLFCSQRRRPWNVGSLITQLTKSFGDKLWFSWQSISIFFGQDRSCYIFLVGVGSALWSVNPPHPIHYWSTAGGSERGPTSSTFLFTSKICKRSVHRHNNIEAVHTG